MNAHNCSCQEDRIFIYFSIMKNMVILWTLTGFLFLPIAIATPNNTVVNIKKQFSSSAEVAIAMANEIHLTFKPIIQNLSKESAKAFALRMETTAPKIELFGKVLKEFPKPSPEELKIVAKRVHSLNRDLKPFLDEIGSIESDGTKAVVDGAMKKFWDAMEKTEPIMEKYFPDKKMNALSSGLE